MSEKAGAGDSLVDRLGWLRATADRMVDDAERAVREADDALVLRRAEIREWRQKTAATWAEWHAQEIESRVTAAQNLLVSRSRLWETEVRRASPPALGSEADADAEADAIVSALELAVARLSSPFRSKRYWTGVAVSAARRADELVARENTKLDEEARTALEKATAGRSQAVAVASGAWRQRLAGFRTEAAAARSRLDRIAPPATADWSTWTPVATPVDALRLGTYTRGGPGRTELAVPAAWTFPLESNLVLRTGRANTEHSDIVLGLIGRMLASTPPGQLRLTVVDAISLGSPVRSLSGLNSIDVRLADPALIDYPQIEGKLAELVRRIGRIERDLLGPHRLGSLVEYNQQTDARTEPYHLVVVFDYPRGFSTPDSLTRLDQVMANGPRCGVFTILMITKDDPDRPHHLELTSGNRARFGPALSAAPENEPWELRLERPHEPTWETSTMLGTVVERVADLARDAGKVVVSLERTFSLLPVATPSALGGVDGVERSVDPADPTTWWQGDASPGLVIPIGSFGLDDVQTLRLGEGTRNHAMVAGTTGSGKTTLLHTIVLAAAMVYSPDELELYLVDLKQGVEFQDYAVRQLPHARQVAIHSEREFGLETMRTLLAEIDTRAALFKRYGVENLAHYRAARAAAGDAAADGAGAGAGAGTPRLARILLLIDEFHVLFDIDDAVGRAAASSLETLVRMGRAYGIHVLLSSQTPSSPVVMGGGTVRQMEVRIALRCDEQVSRRILAENNPAASQLSLHGEAIYNPSSGQLGSDTRFQVAFADAATRAATLGSLRTLARLRGHDRVPTVYDGDRPGDITRDGVFAGLARTHAATPAGTLRIWLGEPMGLSAPTHVDLSPQPARSLLAIGDDEANVGVLTSVAASLAASGAGAVRVTDLTVTDLTVIDFTVIDFTAENRRYSTVHPELAELFPGLRRWTAGQALERIEELADLVRERHADDAFTVGAVSDCRIVVLNGLNRCRGLESSPKGYGAAGVGPGLGTLLEQGSEVGVFVIATIEHSALGRVHRDILSQFGVVLTRRQADAYDDRVSALVGRQATRLRAGQALLVDDGEATRLRPYVIPPPGWLRDFSGRPEAEDVPVGDLAGHVLE